MWMWLWYEYVCLRVFVCLKNVLYCIAKMPMQHYAVLFNAVYLKL